MAEVKVLYDEIGNTLTVWFGNPADARQEITPPQRDPRHRPLPFSSSPAS
jgi:hypothetical protein